MIILKKPLSKIGAHRRLTNIPLVTAKVKTDAATRAATLQFVELVIVNSEGRFTEGPAMSSATAAPIGAPDPSSIRAKGISKKVGKANGTATAATTMMAKNCAVGELNVRTGII